MPSIGRLFIWVNNMRSELIRLVTFDDLSRITADDLRAIRKDYFQKADIREIVICKVYDEMFEAAKVGQSSCLIEYILNSNEISYFEERGFKIERCNNSEDKTFKISW